MAKTLANLRQFVNVIRHNEMIDTLDEIWVIPCWVKGRKKEQELINTNVVTRHNAIAMSRDQQSWRSSFSVIQISLLFPVFSLWKYPLSFDFMYLMELFLIFENFQFLFRKIVFKNYWSFYSAEFTMLLLLFEF